MAKKKAAKIQVVESAGFGELWEKPLSRNSETSLGERLNKATRTRLVVICVEAIKDEQEPSYAPRRRVGRPCSVEALLAQRVSVTTRTVRNWLDESPGRACDCNSELLAETSYRLRPEETAAALREDAQAYLNLVNDWLDQAESEFMEKPISRN